MIKEETIVRLKIVSLQHTPEEITGLLGISYDYSLHIGDNRAKSAILAKEHEWHLNSGLPKDRPLDDHIKVLLNRLTGLQNVIDRLAKDSAIELSCVIYCNSAPALNFPKLLIQQLEAMGASLDIDLYFRESVTH